MEYCDLHLKENSEKTNFNSPKKNPPPHSVLEEVETKGSYPEQRLPQYESLYPIRLKSARIEIPHIGSHAIDF